MTSIDFEVKDQGLIYPGHMKILSAQYMENPVLDRHQTWYTVTA